MPRSSSRSFPRSDAAAWSQAGWFVLVVVTWSVLLLGARVDPDYTAGELLDHLMSWRESGVLYPVLGSQPALRVFNYPPLVLVAARGLAALGVPDLMAGRLVNGAGLVALLAAVAWWTRARLRSFETLGESPGETPPRAALATVAGTIGLLGASFPLLYAAGQFHIELWAVALTVWGFALLDRANSWTGVAIGAVALAAGCFAKQTQVVPAIIALAWTWARRRDVALVATLTFAVGAALGAGAITAAWGAEPWRQMLTYSVGTYSAANLGWQLLSHVAPLAILMAFAARTAWAQRDRWNDPALWYFVGAAAWCLSAARIGSGYPYFLDLHVATVVLAGPRLFEGAMPRRDDAEAGHGATRGWRSLIAAQLIGANIGVVIALGVNHGQVARTDAALPALCAQLANAPRLLAEEAGVLRACGLRPQIHPFIMASLAAQGRWDAALFEEGLKNGRYTAVLLPFDPRLPVTGAHAERWTPGALAAFAAAPQVEQLGGGRWLARWGAP